MAFQLCLLQLAIKLRLVLLAVQFRLIQSASLNRPTPMVVYMPRAAELAVLLSHTVL